MKFVVVSCKQKYGGAVVLHRLAELLEEFGHDTKIFLTDIGSPLGKDRFPMPICILYTSFRWVILQIKDILLNLYVKIMGEKFILKFSPELYNEYCYKPIKGCKRKWLPFVSKDTIVIYPDIVWGNPLRAKKVVRYYLYHNRYKNDERATSSSDLVYTYREVFNDYKLNPDCNILYTPYFDLNLYKRNNFGKRNGTCYIIRKGKDRDDLPTEINGVVIDDLTEKQKVEVFNSCEYCVSYDTQTAYSSIAALCGCISVVIPEKGKKRKDYLSEGEQGFGVAFGFEKSEIEYAKSTVGKLYEEYEKINNDSINEVEKFIKKCKQYFGEDIKEE